MNYRGLVRIDTHSMRLQVLVEPFCALAVPEFRLPLPQLLDDEKNLSRYGKTFKADSRHMFFYSFSGAHYSEPS